MRGARQSPTSRHAAFMKTARAALCLRLQKHSIARYQLGAAAARRADDYARKLYKQFGLVSDESPIPARHPALARYYANDAGG